MMIFQETETMELKKSTSELKEAIIPEIDREAFREPTFDTKCFPNGATNALPNCFIGYTSLKSGVVVSR